MADSWSGSVESVRYDVRLKSELHLDEVVEAAPATRTRGRSRRGTAAAAPTAATGRSRVVGLRVTDGPRRDEHQQEEREQRLVADAGPEEEPGQHHAPVEAEPRPRSPPRRRR